jgi:hypothetical protein
MLYPPVAHTLINVFPILFAIHPTSLYLGDVYEGDFSDDVKHGDGVLTTSAGDVYTGDFKDDAISGMGAYVWATGDVYTGLWASGKMHGYGEYKW